MKCPKIVLITFFHKSFDTFLAELCGDIKSNQRPEQSKS